MANLSLKHIYKVYDGKVKAVNDFCMEIKDKEFIVFVGPSGCGKSTTLRMIAGLEEISAGELRIDDVIVNDFEPKDRNIAMVFQNYALYPHMTVYENMAFSLKIFKLSKEEIHEKVIEAAKILGITEYLDRKPKALSGGQRQRVALGRAIVRNPKVFLLDEPLSNLDAKLRAAMRAEITRLHERLNATFIYVTHDQVEAMTMGTRIVVMKLGYVQQIDTPQNLYKYPSNMFVAGFIGTPQMNFFDGTIVKNGDEVTFNLDCGTELKVDYRIVNKIMTKYMDGNHKVVVGIRPDDVKLYDGQDDNYVKVKAVVSVVEALGSETILYANLNTDNIDGTDAGAITIKAGPDCFAKRGDIVDIAINKHNLHVFDKETEESIKIRVPVNNVLTCSVKNNAIDLFGQVFDLPEAIKAEDKDNVETTLPTRAVILGSGNGKAKVIKVETVDKVTLYELEVNGKTMFATELGEAKYSEGEELNFGIDYKQIAIPECNVEPINLVNSLKGDFVKIKEKGENGKKKYNFYFRMAGQQITAVDEISTKLFACKDAKIFKTPLEYIFDVNDVRLCSENVPNATLLGTVKEVLAYGEEKYAKVSVGEETVVVEWCDGINVGDSVNLAINVNNFTVKDSALDIIIV